MLLLSIGVTSSVQSGPSSAMSLVALPKKAVSDVTPVSNPYIWSMPRLQQHPAMPSSRPRAIRPSTEIRAKPLVIDLKKDQSYQSSLGYRVPLDAPMKLYSQLGLVGNLEQLSFEETRLQADLGQFLTPDFVSNRLPVWVQGDRYQLKRRLSFILKVMRHDVTQVMHTVQSESLEDAKRALQAMHVDVYGRPHLAYGPAVPRPTAQMIVPSKFTPAQLREAEQVYCSRADYKLAMKRSQVEPEPSLPKPDISHTDPILTTPTMVPEISLDVDARIMHELQERVVADPATDFEAYMKQMGDVLQDIQQKGELTPAEQRNLLAHFIEKVVEKSDPATQFEKRTVALKGTLKYFFEMEFGSLYMSDEQMVARLDQACHTVDVLSKFDLSQVTAEQWVEVIATIVADLPYDIATLQVLSLVQDIGALGKVEAALEQLPVRLQKAYKLALVEHPELIARTAEGIPIKLTAAELGELSLLKNTADKLPGSASRVAKVANMRQFFTKFEFGETLANNSTKLKRIYKGQTIYRLDKKVNDLMKKGYHYYLDSLHFDHIEVFDNHGMAKFVLNLDGTQNIAKTQQVLRDARRIPM